MDNSCKPRVLFADNNPEDVNDWVPRLEDAGYQTKGIIGSGEDLIQRTGVLASEFRPHVAVVDLRIQFHPSMDSDKREDVAGLKFKQILDQAEVILYSAHLSTEIDRLAHKKNFTSYVAKGEPPEVLLDEIEKAAMSKSACFRGFLPELPEGWTGEKMTRTLFPKAKSPVPDSLVIDVIGQLFSERDSVLLQTLDLSISSPKSPTRGRSIVWKARTEVGTEPFIIKFAGAQDISAEYRNYKAVQPHIKGGFYAQLVDHKTFWDAGAVLYRFMGNPPGTLSIFSKFYAEQNDPKAILRPLEFFLGTVWKPMYDERKLLDVSQWEAYDLALFNPHQKEDAGLADRLKDYPNKEQMISLPDLSGRFRNPVVWLLRHRSASHLLRAQVARTHGDLHGDNLFVSNEFGWAIDFERSGWGPVLRDFVQLEMDSVTRLIPEGISLKLIYQLCTALTNPTLPTDGLPIPASFRTAPDLLKAFLVIQRLRNMAVDLAAYDDIAELYWGLLFDAIFIVTHIHETESQHERALLYAAVLCERLRHRDGKWPLDSWDPVEFLPSAPLPLSEPLTPGLHNTFEYDAFFSYNSQDRHLVRPLVNDLLAKGFHVWFGETNVRGGEPLNEKLLQGESASACAIVCWGTNERGAWQNEQILEALEQRIRQSPNTVIPVLLSGARPVTEMPDWLRSRQRIDFGNALNNIAAMNELVLAINAIVRR